MDQALPDFSRVGRYLVCAVFVAILVLCGLLMRKPGGAANGTAGKLPAIGKLGATENLAEQERRQEIARLGPIQRDGVNGADIYAKAMALYSRLSDADQRALQDWSNDWIDDPKWSTDPKLRANAAFYGRLQPILSLLRQARKADYLDWGIDPRNPGGSSDLWVVSRVGLWSAAYEFQADPELAVGDLAAAQALGWSWSSGSREFSYSPTSEVFTMLAQNAPLVPEDAAADLNYILDPAAAMQSVRDAFKTNEALAQVLSEPPAQFQQWINQVYAGSPGPKSVASGAAYGLATAEQDMVEAAMFEAGMALEQGDQAQFQSITDPATGAPFVYTQTDSGFQLRSNVQGIYDPSTVGFSFSGNVLHKTVGVAVGEGTVTLEFPWVAPRN